MTLVELLIASVVGGIVITAIAGFYVTSTINEVTVTGRSSDSASAQLTSEYFIRDVQSAALITTPTAAAVSSLSPSACGNPPGASLLLAMSWGASGSSSEVSYWSVPTAGSTTTADVMRYYCTVGSSVPSSTVHVASGIAASASSTLGTTVTISPSSIASAASAGWTTTVGMADVELSGIEKASGFHFDLLGTSRLSTPASLHVPPGGSGAAPSLLLIGSATPVVNCAGSSTSNISINGIAEIESSSSGSGVLGTNSSMTAGAIYTADPTPSSAFTGKQPTPSPQFASSQGDPYASLAPPVVTNPTYSDNAYHGPGVYTKTLTLSSPGTTTLATGIYVLQNGISVSGQANLTSDVNGVLLYVTGGQVSFSGQGTVSLSPLNANYWGASGTYDNIGIWQASSDTSQLQLSGNGTANTYSGVIYAPGAAVAGVGNAGFQASSVVSSSFVCSGNGTARLGY